MIPMISRSIVQAMMIAAGLHKPTPRETSFVEEGAFDISPLPADKSKIYGPRDAALVDLVTAHVTDVRGGFGVSKTAVRRWRKLIDTSAVPLALFPDVDVDDMTPERLALWERYRRLGYHRIGGTNGDVIRNHPIALRTKHGNAGNDGVGWALDVGHNEPLDDFMVETGRASLRLAILDTFEAGPDRWITVVPHRVFSAMRLNDTNVYVWRNVVLSVVAELHEIARIDYELREGTGKPVPRSWDSSARYDDRGRRTDVE